MNHDALLATVQAFIRNRGLPLRIRRKRSSALMWVAYVGLFMWLWNRRFMSGFITTVFGRIYVPDGLSSWELWRVLAHEGMHLEQARRDGEVQFSLAYAFPASLALLAVGAVGAIACPWALLCLVSLVAVLPLPAPHRVRDEREAYLVSAVCDAMAGIDVTSDWYFSAQVDYFVGWDYYRPAWNRRRTAEQVRADIIIAKRIADGEVGSTYAHELARAIREPIRTT